MTRPYAAEPGDKDPREPIPDPGADTRQPVPMVRLLVVNGPETSFSFHATVAEAAAAAETYPKDSTASIESGRLDGFNFIPE